MAGAGINWVRVPIAFWAIETWPGEPFLAQKSWKYVGNFFQLLREITFWQDTSSASLAGVGSMEFVCISICILSLDHKTVDILPAFYFLAHNLFIGFNHSGRKGQINFLHGVMGMANAQRTLNYIRVITQFISQPEWRNVVVMFGVMNEAIPRTIGENEMRALCVFSSLFGRIYSPSHFGFVVISRFTE